MTIQLWEAPEAFQTETAQREGAAPLLGSPQGNLRTPGSGGEAVMDDREVDPRWGGDGSMASPHSGP